MLQVQIVDDEPIVRMGLKHLIPWEDYDFKICCEAQNGAEALEQLELYDIDLIITDIEMPIMNGIEYIKLIKNRKKKPKIIILTAYAEFEYAKTAIEVGVLGYILKPIDEGQIIETLDQIRKSEIIKVNRNYNREDDRELIKYILLSDNRAFDVMDQIIEKERSYGIEELNNTCFRLNSILEEVANQLLSKYENINKLEPIYRYLEFQFIDQWTKERVLNEFKENVTMLFQITSQYHLMYKDNIVRQACNYVVSHIDEKISLSVVSEELGISKNYFCSLFKNEIGENFNNYVTKIKMKRAKFLLKEKNMKIYEVCDYLGYADNTYFTKLFKKYVGITPHEYKKAECETYDFSKI